MKKIWMMLIAGGIAFAAAATTVKPDLATLSEFPEPSGGYVTLTGGAYKVTAAHTVTETASSRLGAVRVANGAKVTLWFTKDGAVTAQGSEATSYDRAGAGVHLPAGATLVLRSADGLPGAKFTAVGGDGIKAGAGGQGQAYNHGVRGGIGGRGSFAGGAGIGGYGGLGGSNGKGGECTGTEALYQDSYYCGSWGSAGRSGGDAGTLIVYDLVAVTATAGASFNDEPSGGESRYVNGYSTGGGGAGGISGPSQAIGGGGAGGGGGGGGSGSGGKYSDTYTRLKQSAGGGGGAPYGRIGFGSGSNGTSGGVTTGGSGGSINGLNNPRTGGGGGNAGSGGAGGSFVYANGANINGGSWTNATGTGAGGAPNVGRAISLVNGADVTDGDTALMVVDGAVDTDDLILPVKTHAVFYGYYTAAEGGQQIIAPDGTLAATPGDDVTTLYAHFSEWDVVTQELNDSGVSQLANDTFQTGSHWSFADGKAASLDLAGHTLTLADGEFLALVDGGANFTVTDSVGGGRIIAGSSAVATDGGCVVVSNGTFNLTGGTLCGFRTTGRGGAVAVSSGGTFAFSAGTLSECSAAAGGSAVAIDAGGAFAWSGGTISQCGAGSSVAAIACAGAATVTGGLAQGNGGDLYALEGAGTIVFYGGIFERLNASAPLAADTIRIEKSGWQGVICDEPYGFDANGKMLRGTFTFNPTNAEYAAAGTFIEAVGVTEAGGTPARYLAALKTGAVVAVTTTNGVTVTVREQSGEVVVGDGASAAIPATTTRLALEPTYGGYTVAGISEHAFDGCDALGAIAFTGAPYASVPDGVFPSGAKGVYSEAFATAWESEIVDGRWHGLAMWKAEPCGDWATLKATLEAGLDAYLTADIAQPADARIEVTGGDIELHLNGRTLTAQSGAVLFKLTGGTLRLTGNGTVIAPWNPDGKETTVCANVGESATFVLEAATLTGFSSSYLVEQSAVLVEGGEFRMTGGVITNCFSLGYGTAVRCWDGTFEMTGGVISNNTASWVSGFTDIHVRDYGISRLWGGVFAVAPYAELLAEGSTAHSLAGFVVVARPGAFVTASDGTLIRGTFTFDPAAAGLPIFAESQVTADYDSSPTVYTVGIPEGHVFTCDLNGVTATCKISQGTVVLGDGAATAIDPATTRLTVPETVYGYAFGGFASHALAACTALEYITFAGDPPALGAELNALPPQVKGIYLPAHADAWEAALATGQWSELAFDPTACDSWARVVENLASGTDVTLVNDVAQSGAAAATSATNAVDLGGFTLTGSGTTFTGTAGGRLTLSGGTFRDVSLDGAADAVRVAGGVYENLAVASDSATVWGGVFDAEPTAVTNGVVTKIGARYLVASESLGYDGDGTLVKGAFTFDPFTAPESAHLGFTLSHDCVLASVGGEPCLWRIQASGRHFINSGLVDLFYDISGNAAYWGNGVSAIVTNATVPIVSLPDTAGGYEIVGITTNAFRGLADLASIDFIGKPPRYADDGAFAGLADVLGYYSADALSEWQAVIDEDGLWYGLKMTRSANCRTWAGIVRNAMDGVDSALAADVAQDGDELAFGPSSNGQIVLDLGGFDLRLADGKRLATVASNDCFVLSGSGRVISGSAEFGGAVYVAADGRFALAGPTITNATATFQGGAVYVAEGGLFNFSSGAIAGCTAPQGGGVAAFGEFRMNNGELAGNRSTVNGRNGGGGLYVGATGKATVNGGTFSGNSGGGGGGAACADGGTLAIFGGTFTGNVVTGMGSVLSVTNGGSVDVYGGVVTDSSGVSYHFNRDAAPIRTYGGIAPFTTTSVVSGFAQYHLSNGLYVTHSATNDFITTSDGAVMAGTFTFDPRDALYTTAGLEVLDECEITMSGDEPTLYTAKIVQGGPYTATVDGRTWTYCVLNGKAVLGDGTNPVTTNDVATLQTLRVPETINGFAIDGLAANAFLNCTALDYVIFQGDPPSTLDAQALPSGVTSSYAPSHAAAWEAVIADGKWRGLTMKAGLSCDWTAVRENLEAGQAATLVANVAQDGAAASVTDVVTLELNGFTLTGWTKGRVAEIAGGELTVIDAAGTGAITGPGAVLADNGGAFRVSGGVLYLYGGTIRDFRAANGGAVSVGSGGRLVLNGATIRACVATGAGGAVWAAADAADGIAPIVDLEGGAITACTAGTDGGAVACSGAGELVLAGGRYTQNGAQNGGALGLTGGATLTASGGAVIENTATAEGAAVYLASGAVGAVAGGHFGGASGAGVCGLACAANASLVVRGGLFAGAVAEAYLDYGWEQFAFGDGCVVAKENSVSVIDGILTAGVFAFDPSMAEYDGLIVSDTERQIVTPTGGTPATWTVSFRDPVTCTTWEEVRANVNVGNRIVFAMDFAPPRAKKIPSGFVYSGRVLKGATPEANKTDLTVKVSLYAEKTGGEAVWHGEWTNVKTDANGSFSLWIDDTARTSGTGGALTNVFAAETGCYLGVSFGAGGAECSPRRALMPAPLANRSDSARCLDDVSTTAILDGRDGAVTCGTLDLAYGLVGTLAFTTSNTVFNVAEADVGGAILYRDAENVIVSRTTGSWVTGTIRPGDVLVRNAAKSGLLTIQSTDGCTVPLLTFPVPTGGTFVWRSISFEGRYRFTFFGE